MRQQPVPQETILSATQQQVLDSLSKVMSPRGVALTKADVLSEITVTDGKVYFAINVDAAEVRAWEDVRAQGRSRGARHSRRHRRDGGADRRTQAGRARRPRDRALRRSARIGRRRDRDRNRRCRGRRKFPASRR